VRPQRLHATFAPTGPSSFHRMKPTEDKEAPRARAPAWNLFLSAARLRLRIYMIVKNEKKVPSAHQMVRMGGIGWPFLPSGAASDRPDSRTNWRAPGIFALI